jgi:hypothetical protein
MLRKPFAVTALLVSACTPSSQPPTIEPPVAARPVTGTAADATAQDTCNTARYRDLIGSNISESTLSESMDTRILFPDSIATQDFRPDRLNIIVDAEGRITSLECY